MPIGRLVKRKMEFVKKQVNTITSSMAIIPSGHPFRAGEMVHAAIRLRLRSPIWARSLVAWISCTRAVRTKVSREMDTHDYREDKDVGVPRSTHLRTTYSVSERISHREEKRLAGEGEFASEEHHVEFRLPQNAPPTRHSFGHDNAKSVWRIGAKLDVPYAFDISSSKEIIVEG